MNAHVKACKQKQIDAVTLPPVSLAAEDDCEVDDTVSKLSQFQNPPSDDEEEKGEPNQVGQKRRPDQPSQDLEQ